MSYGGEACCGERGEMTNTEFKNQLERRTQTFSANVLKTLMQLPEGPEFQNIRRQVVRSATAIGTNYRESNHAESRADFVHKLAIVSKEASETEYWLRLCLDVQPESLALDIVWREADELNRLFHKIRLSCGEQGKPDSHDHLAPPLKKTHNS